MCLKFVRVMAFFAITLSCYAQSSDSLKELQVGNVVVTGNAQKREKYNSPLSVEIVDAEEIAKHFSGNLMQSLEYIPGVQSMSVGSGFSKPMIRGMGFNRVTVIDGGVKQEGQQWGADHGLEIDAFNVERVNIRKGSSSLLYGSDAMGGAVEILKPLIPRNEGMSGSIDLLGRSVNGLVGGSLMLDYRKGNWFFKARHSEQYFGDFGVPTDTIIYLSQKIPITDNHINNSAGHERATSLYSHFQSGNYTASLLVSNVYQKVGFFPGAHGVPDPSRVVDDGSRRDIDLPYSYVNHFKAVLSNEYWWERVSLVWDLSYQNNHREEWSLFHTHYLTQEPPAVDPNLEIELKLDNYSSNIMLNIPHSYSVKSSVSVDVAYQQNRIGGYSFLLPNYNRFTSGVAWVTEIKPSDKLTLSGGLRYDYGHINTMQYRDDYLAEYLSGLGYPSSVVDENVVRSYPLDRGFGDYSLSAGGVWRINGSNRFHFNIGRSFRLPSANELVSNGVHHSSFRHEQGDPSLDSERGWQLDLSHELKYKWLTLNISPFASWYASFIYQRPTGEWSVLPHAGQIYRYSQCQALFAGAEVSANVDFPAGFSYNSGFEYTYTRNLDENIPITFSPPTTLLNTFSWASPKVELAVNWKIVAEQNHIARNEEPTPGAQLLGASVLFPLPFISDGAQVVLSVDNIFNTKYLNHLSFYRSVEISEEGRNFQLSLKIPFLL